MKNLLRNNGVTRQINFLNSNDIVKKDKVLDAKHNPVVLMSPPFERKKHFAQAEPQIVLDQNVKAETK